MKITGTTCYSHLLWLMCSGELIEHSINSLKFSSPNFSHESVAGYIETKYEIEVKDLVKFSHIWEGRYTLPDKRRLGVYGLAKGLGDCK